jgi:uncharacterized RDD family membrane protein YckC
VSDNPSGWYRDPAEPTTQRYWDGDGWVGDRLPVDATPPDGPLHATPAADPSLSPGDIGRIPAALPLGPYSAGNYPPGAYPPGASPPGALPPGALPPGALPPGAYPPGAFPPDAFQPGTYSPGAYPPSAFPPGAFPPGAFPPGAFPPGAYPPDAFQPGAYSPGAYPPGAFPPGSMPPGSVPPGSVPPGATPAAGQVGTLPPGFPPPGFPYSYGPYVLAPAPAPRPHGFALAPLGSRFIARLIDICMVVLLNVVLNGYLIYRFAKQAGPYVRAAEHAQATGETAPTGGNLTTLAYAIIFFAMIIWAVYEVPATGRTGQTLGKRLMHLRVMPLEGDHPLGGRRALRRFIPMGLPMMAWLFLIGFVIQFIDALSPTFNRPLRLALHDAYAATVVVALPRADPSGTDKPANGGNS